MNNLIHAIIDAGQDFADANANAGAFYVQKTADGDGTYSWDAAFAEDDTTPLETQMTRWVSGDEAAHLFDAALNSSIPANLAQVETAAAEIDSGWDEDWTD